MEQYNNMFCARGQMKAESKEKANQMASFTKKRDLFTSLFDEKQHDDLMSKGEGSLCVHTHAHRHHSKITVAIHAKRVHAIPKTGETLSFIFCPLSCVVYTLSVFNGLCSL